MIVRSFALVLESVAKSLLTFLLDTGLFRKSEEKSFEIRLATDDQQVRIKSSLTH